MDNIISTSNTNGYRDYNSNSFCNGSTNKSYYAPPHYAQPLGGYIKSDVESIDIKASYKLPQWKIGTQVTYWDDSTPGYFLGIITSAFYRNDMWIYIINNTKILEKDIKDLIEVDNQGLIQQL